MKETPNRELTNSDSTERPTPTLGNLIRAVNSNQYIFISEDIQSNNLILELAPLPEGRIPDSFIFHYTINQEIIAAAAKYKGKGLTISSDIITNPIIELSSTPDQFQLKPIPKSGETDYISMMTVRIKNVETGRYFTLDWNASVFKARNLSEKYSTSLLLMLYYKIQKLDLIYNNSLSTNSDPFPVGIVDQFLSIGLSDDFNYIKEDGAYKFQLKSNLYFLYVTEINGEYFISAKEDVNGEYCHFIIEEPEEPFFYLFNAPKNMHLISSIDFSPGGNNILEAYPYNNVSPNVPFDGLFTLEEI